MAIQVQFRRGTDAQNNAFTGANGEISVDSTNNTLRVHDGTTAGGVSLITPSLNVTLTNKVYNGSSLSVTGNVIGGNLNAGSGTVSTTGNVSANLVLANILSVGSIQNSSANGVGNIGNATGYFNTVFAKATSAQYADLAEMYEADSIYEPGTVVSFGGDHQITLSKVDGDKRVAGVVSTNPSYLMNSVCSGLFPTPIALTGMAPTKVTGAVRKGDMVVSNGDGTARAEENPSVGSVIGKSLEDFYGTSGVVNVVVGRF
jgi:hypothetical protein